MKPHGKGIQLTIYYRGERLRPTLPLAPTTSNLRHAARVLAEIRRKIQAGTFEPADYFPEYRGLPAAEATKGQTFEHYVDALLAYGKARLSPSTLDVYRKVLRGFWQKKFEGREIRSIRSSEIAAIMGETPWRSLKTYNNWLSCLRRVFALAIADGLKTDPTANITRARPQKAQPDPFSQAEADRIIAHYRARGTVGEAFADYFEFAFYSGLRPSEQIAMLWQDCDLSNATIRVCRARVVGVDRAQTKTAREREVELTGRALGALKRQQARSRLADKHVWLNPRTLKRYADEQAQYKSWRPALEQLGIRYRVPYNTRHTRATMMLMAGANPAWCAKQLGHSPEMFWRVYSKWIDGADKGKELAKVERFETATNTATK